MLCALGCPQHRHHARRSGRLQLGVQGRERLGTLLPGLQLLQTSMRGVLCTMWCCFVVLFCGVLCRARPRMQRSTPCVV